jgi:small multidrug resistance pump
MKILAAIVAMITCTVAANLLMKTGASAQAAGPEFLSKALSWPVMLGIACFGAAAVIYVLILTWLPLNVAQSFASAQFIAVIVAARIFLAEPISDAQWAGIALISLGIAVVGWSR